MKKILIVFGTRPEAIKMAPLVKQFQQHTNTFETRVCVTAQHREMLDQVLNIFEIKPHYDLNIMKSGQNLYDITSNVLINMQSVLDEFQPDIVLVHGDTTTTFAAALASFYKKIEVAHVEAGLRTYDIYSPFPEEINRQLTTKLATYHFAPTEEAKDNLIKEGVNHSTIFVTGNTVIDALHLTVNRINDNENLLNSIISSMQYRIKDNRRFILVTGHRRENFGQGFLNICEALKMIALNNKGIDIVYPVHLNPSVRIPVNNILAPVDNIHLIEPMTYESFVYLMSKSHIVITDSGGIQEEAPSLGKPVLVMRETTERPEALKAGTVKLVGTNVQEIVSETQILLDSRDEYNFMSKIHNPYGDGSACIRIIKALQ
jgi:UDP-N-acetylglucosamine 2-epimerase (non-hydrolysing)